MSELPDPLNEPRGRWENRCPFTWNLDTGTILSVVRLMVCDRPVDHAGLHRGRILRLSTQNTVATVIGYAGRAG